MNLSSLIMEKIMNINKILINFTIVAILLIVGIPTVYKVIKTHQTNLLIVSEKRIVEAAIKCINKGDCEKEKVTLKELYAKRYLSKEADPLTKEYYNELSYVKLNNNDYVFIKED